MSNAPSPAEARSTSDTIDGLNRFIADNLAKARYAAGERTSPDKRGLFTLLREENCSAYPMFALLALGVSTSLGGSAAAIASPDIARTFDLNPQFVSTMALVGQVISFFIPLTVARMVQHAPRRALILLSTQAIWCLITGLHGLVLSVGALVAIDVADRVTSSAHGTVAGPLMIDLYPPLVRVRVVGFLAASALVTGLVSTSVTAVLTGPLGLGWRGVFLVLSVISFGLFLFALRLRDPGFGAHDTEVVRQQARTALAENAETPATNELLEGTKLTIAEAIKRIYGIASMRIMLIAVVVAGLPAPIAIYLQFFYANRFSLSTSQRAMMSFATGATMLVSYIVLAPLGDRIFQRSPKLLFWISGGLGIVGSVISLGQIFVYSVPALVAFAIVGSAFTGLTGPAMTVGTMSVVPGPLRPHVGAVTALASLIGTAVGTALLGGLTTSLGIPAAVALSTAIGLISTVLSMVAGNSVQSDIDRSLEETLEKEYIQAARSENRSLPLLSVRRVCYSYGQTQVLFDVDFAVQSGEIVSLLGVNGSGKTTLLRAISGLGQSTAGTIRLDGHDITYIDPERRARLGIVQVSGGRAVFPDLSVMDNLRTFGFALPAEERHLLPARIDKVLHRFPGLRSRVHLPAAALSGGEQQMLGLAKALILQPRLLLIDELSLGLAPRVVAELLDIVREINATGVAVVLVEQSVSVAMSISERAYFLERGEVRFAGPVDELNDNDALLRAVFLAPEVRR